MSVFRYKQTFRATPLPFLILYICVQHMLIPLSPPCGERGSCYLSSAHSTADRTSFTDNRHTVGCAFFPTLLYFHSLWIFCVCVCVCVYRTRGSGFIRVIYELLICRENSLWVMFTGWYFMCAVRQNKPWTFVALLDTDMNRTAERIFF